ncbi:MAG: hypothetical protein ACREV5_11330 [Steroidobacter sp.]
MLSRERSASARAARSATQSDPHVRRWDGDWNVLAYLVDVEGGTNNRIVMYGKAAIRAAWLVDGDPIRETPRSMSAQLMRQSAHIHHE